MADLLTLIANMRGAGDFRRLATNPRVQFGPPNQQFLGARFLPNRPVSENGFVEENISFRTVMANAGTRYGPVQLKGSNLVSTMNVILAESDIGAQLTGRDFDTLVSLLRTGADTQAAQRITRFADRRLNLPLEMILEYWRWQAIVNASIVLVGDNDYTDTINYSNPAGHRIAAAGTWSDDTYDPFEDIFGIAKVLTDKGFGVRAFVTSTRVVNILGGNAKVRAQTNRITVDAGGQITAVMGRASAAEINAVLAMNNLPPIVTYDLQYRTQTGSGRYLPDTVFVAIADTDLNEDLDLGDGRIEVIPNTLGYTAIGRGVGQPGPGRVIEVNPFPNTKPPRVEGEAWQTALPVLLIPEAVAVLTGIN